ncbi:MAG TPA: hypothetical protein VJU87_01480 [Gemmatimonadaceae bacterium]|nr:hypothetical protein [Gemmatimonadaceae bacterium]
MSKILFDPREYPDHHDAELVLRLYELRRDPAMRESRHAIATKFLPRTFDELMLVARRDHPLNAAFRQTSTYWEMTYSMARYGIIHPDFLMESNGEGMLLYAKVAPYLDEYRRATTPRAFVNAEWVATHSELGREVFARMRDQVRQLVAAA